MSDNVVSLNRNPLDALDLPKFEGGSVWLAGAGPGDPGLITALGIHALQNADVVLHDALINEALLKLARPGADILYAGKRGGKKSCKQSDISRTLVSLARKGKRVLRLKGGDPFVFGRGAEEALTLARAGIPFRIVPGVTAGIGGLAYAGIPVTHREVNSAVAFITGHDASGLVPDSVDWESLSRGAPVLVIYMALKHIEPIVERLLAAGRSPAEPIAVVSKATTSAQRVLVSSLAEAASDAAAARIEAPTIIVIGEVVRLRAALDWLGAGDAR